ncbi:DUF588 domain-containing protein [Cephalotus follicularis]|uniref:CASP-like protein n=1 Tax=Cephalotus follicularis TaxID=3775 RepID=A0A1Q3D4C5_CEPFO|nr:DUF588 domain-containing protein [Cephalotus follicularis]
MASTDKPDLEAPSKSEIPPPPPPRPYGVDFFTVGVAFRVLLFATTLVSVIVMVTSDQTKTIFVPGSNIGFPVPAKFNHSPAFIYFVAALSVACFYSIITTLASLSVIFKPYSSTKLLLHFAIWDVLILGIVASATGTAGGVAYIGLKGNSHVNWNKICNSYDTFCHHVESSIFISLLAAILLVLLSIISTVSLYDRIPK